MGTRAEVRDLVGQALGVLPLNQVLESQDAARIDRAYNTIYAKLKKDGQAVWALAGSVPDDLEQHFADRIADSLVASGTYSVSDKRHARITIANAIAEREIRKLTTPDYTSQSRADDF